MTKDRFIELASEFRKTKLWEYLTDSDVFGITLQDGRIVYCCVMGNSGIHKGLGVFVGENLPLQISVPNEATEGLLKAFCQRQGIKLVRERLPLRELNKAWEGVFAFFDREGDSGMLMN